MTRRTNPSSSVPLVARGWWPGLWIAFPLAGFVAMTLLAVYGNRSNGMTAVGFVFGLFGWAYGTVERYMRRVDKDTLTGEIGRISLEQAKHGIGAIDDSWDQLRYDVGQRGRHRSDPHSPSGFTPSTAP
jgi:hypothetical protein